MMQVLRKKTRYVLFIALATFALLIFFQWGLNITGIRREQQKNIVEVDGLPVTYAEYVKYAQQKEQQSREVSRDEIWRLMIDEIMWSNLLKKEKMTVSDEEVWAVIRNNPPREIYESEFMKDEKGEFDFNKYYELLRAPQSRPWLLEYENNLRRQIPREKLRALMSTFGWVSPFEDSMLITEQTTEYKVSYLNLPVYRARALLNISDQEMREYYANNVEEFTQPELKIFKYVFFERKPSAYDTLESKERIEDFIDRIENGEDFLKLAYEVSDDTSVVVDFDSETELKPYLVAVYKGLKNGEMSDIIQTAQGFEVVKRERAGLLYRVATRIEVSPTTRGEIYDKIMSFKEIAREWGFDSAAVDFGLTVRRTYPLSKDNATFPVRNQEYLGKFVTDSKRGEIGGPFSSFGGYYLFALDSIIPETRPQFESIMQKIRARIEREKVKEAIEQKLDAYYDKLVGGMTMENIASLDTLVGFHENDAMTLGQLHMTFGAEFAGGVAALESGQFSSPLMTELGGYIIRCDTKTVEPFDSTMIATLQAKRQGRLRMITENMFTPKKLEDNRDLFFE